MRDLSLGGAISLQMVEDRVLPQMMRYNIRSS